MAETIAGKFSIYVKDSKLKRDIKLLAHYDVLSATDLIGRVLQDYTASRAEDLQIMYENEERIAASKKEREQVQQEPQEEQVQEDRQDPRKGNPNLMNF